MVALIAFSDERGACNDIFWVKLENVECVIYCGLFVSRFSYNVLGDSICRVDFSNLCDVMARYFFGIGIYSVHQILFVGFNEKLFLRGFDLTLNFGTVKFIRLSILLLQAENFFLLSGDLFFQLNVLIERLSVFEQGFQIDIGRVDFSLDVINKSDGFFVERRLIAKIFVQKTLAEIVRTSSAVSLNF